jgi:hypothetical protein
MLRFGFLRVCPIHPQFSPFQFFRLVGLLPEAEHFVGNLLKPSDVEDAPETVVNEYLEFV